MLVAGVVVLTTAIKDKALLYLVALMALLELLMALRQLQIPEVEVVEAALPLMLVALAVQAS
jgi:hypothetical protein